MRSNTKAVHAAFVDQLKNDFAAAGIVPHVARFGLEEYTAETVAGPYTFHINMPIPGSKLLFMDVFGRFADPARAVQHTDCNPHNGKWNFQSNGIRKTTTEARGLASCISQRIISMIPAHP